MLYICLNLKKKTIQTLAKKNILVIEDNHAILDVITLILESEAFNVEGLNKGADFITQICLTLAGFRALPCL